MIVEEALDPSVLYPPDKKYLAVGSPFASNSKSLFKGDYDSTQVYIANDIVQHDAPIMES